MDLYLLGCEQPGWRNLLLENGVEHLGLSYWSLRPRMGKRRSMTLAERFPDDHDLLLESGGFQANGKPERMTVGQWEEYGLEYIEFALANWERCTLISEFDCLALGDEWIERMRRERWSTLPPERFLPVWHPRQGLAALERLAERYPRISVVESVVTDAGQSVAPQLRRYISKGLLVHGAALTKPDVAESLQFDTVASSSWLSPMRFGDTILWDGRQLHRYPNRYKQKARGPMYRRWYEENGFDPDAIAADDNNELARLTVWSWLRWEEHVNASRQPSYVVEGAHADALDATETGEVGGLQQELVKASSGVPAAPAPARPRDKTPLPVLGFRDVEVIGEDGQPTSERQITAVGDSVRACDTCFISNRCPAFEPGSQCAFSFPIEIKTMTQARAFRQGLLEMQAQRVAFLRYNEEVSGGYPDENLSKELDRLWKHQEANAEIEDDRDFFKLSMEGRGRAPGGLMSALFGQDIGQRAQPMPQPLTAADTDRVLDQAVSP